MITVREAAKRAGRNPETVRRWIWDGKLPAQKLGNQLFVEERDLARLTGTDRELRFAEQMALLDDLRELHRKLREEGTPVISSVELLDQIRAGDA